MTDAAPPTQGTDPADSRTAFVVPLTVWSRLSDRLNPILVREVQQAMRSRGFVITLGLALFAILLTALVVAADSNPGNQNTGREVFKAALMIMAPILLAVIPIQAFTSMQQEVRGETAEQLLLSRLTPWRIVRGKLAAAMVQFGLFASVFGPLLAMTFLLRGVDVPMITFFMVVAALSCLIATAFCIALGSLSKVKLFSSLAFAAAAFGLGILTVGAMAATHDLVREVSSAMRSRDFWTAMGVTTTALTAALVLCCMVATSMLTHPNENRSTQFRVFGVIATIVGYICVWTVVDRAPDMRYAAPSFGVGAATMLGVFWFFALTEDEKFTPRMRTLVPKRFALAFLSWPFLPGGSRGFVYMLLTSALVVGPAFALPWLYSGSTPHPAPTRLMFGVLGYGFVIAAIGRFVRSWLIPGQLYCWLARGATLALVAFGCLIPTLIEVVADGRVRSWSVLHISNPFWTIEQLERSRYPSEALVCIGAGAAIATALSLRAIARGAQEIAAASSARRNRATAV